MLKVGLTGSIAVGKSFVGSIFEELGCSVLDADRTAREVVAKGTSGFDAVIAYFGTEFIGENGEIDRKKLGGVVFADPEERQKLNSIVHPLVFKEQRSWLNTRQAEDPDGIAIIDAALMIESGSYRRFDKLIVVWCEPKIQLQRLMRRDELSAEAAQQRIDSQMPQEEKKRYADILIDTSGTFEQTRIRTHEAFMKMKAML